MNTIKTIPISNMSEEEVAKTHSAYTHLGWKYVGGGFKPSNTETIFTTSMQFEWDKDSEPVYPENAK
jgi:hypothetical protein